jgi:NAD-dependent deacetylase
MGQVAEKVKQVAVLLQECHKTVVLTGAGVSTESGIPDFKDPGSGLWTKLNPELFTIQAFNADPAQFYKLGRDFFRAAREAVPNKTHLVLGELQQRGLVDTIITQNVDGLHQEGGATRVLEIHGSLRTASCIHCRLRVRMDTVIRALEAGELPPLCRRCGAPVKPDVILFGEALPPSYQEALDEAAAADCLMVIGSSMQVSPANMLPGMTRNLVIINRKRTLFDDRARVVIHGGTSEIMQKIMAQIDAGGKKNT